MNVDEERLKVLEDYLNQIDRRMHERLDKLEERISKNEEQMRKNDVVKRNEFGPVDRRVEKLEGSLEMVQQLRTAMENIVKEPHPYD